MFLEKKRKEGKQGERRAFNESNMAVSENQRRRQSFL
jgi:hypothetical protein